MNTPAENYRHFQGRGAVADLSDRVSILLTGTDRVRYLNGQVTTNVQKIAPGRAIPACLTTAKGRLCADVMITAEADSLRIDADPALRETLAPRLERYIIADDVTLHEAPPDARLFHLLGDPAAMPLLGSLPLQRARRFGLEGWDCWTDAATLAALWPDLAAHFVVLDEAMLETIRIEHGVPRWGFELSEETLPPEAGLERTHIDYHKGCYVGQEVISRLKSIGHVNRQLTGFIGESKVPLVAGMHVFAADKPEKPVATLTSAAWSFALERPIALGYLKRGAPTTGLFVRTPEAPGAEVPVAVKELPLVP